MLHWPFIFNGDQITSFGGIMVRKAMFAGALAISLLSGCASIVSGTNQPVTVDTPGCAAA
jgi:hypothetical protein